MASKTFYDCGCMEQGDQGFVCEQHRVADPRPARAEGWQPIETYADDGEVVVVWNGQPYLGYYQDADGWFADMADGDLLRIDPPPTHWTPCPPEGSER